ncbi:MAG: bifunctional DNA-formamidopyrimidine glycosylase/DNA-(apurinic or apyrimidinic site) lyase [Pseudomonadales bacterium]|nr:bifunctional DNA-formamidopyrimidine glycosylase/DNA-(apurinic or apyrimidinic site) lyase [Pseudomonadales bacterium]
MPELPEVETTKRGISPHLVNRVISRVDVRERRLRWPVPRGFAQRIAGHKVLHITRRAKYLLFQLEHGYFMVHLGMSGSLRLAGANEPLLPHDHLIFHLPNGHSLRLNDPRRFGSALWLGQQPEQHPLLRALGPEPFAAACSANYLFERSRKRKVAIKNFIMDNHIVVGVGNIYASEALFLSGIRPRRAAGRVSRAEYSLLLENIRTVLQASIEQGGTTLRDFVGGDGKPGYFQQTLRVYGKAGIACTVCGTAIKQVAIGQRSSFYCPACQR